MGETLVECQIKILNTFWLKEKKKTVFLND